MAGKGGLGIELHLDRVPMRESGMTAYEIMLSESQERMLMILKPGAEGQALAIFAKYELDCVTIGHLTDTGRLVLRMGDRIEADLPIAPVSAAAPEYDRPWTPTPPRPALDADTVPAVAAGAALHRLLGCPDLASRRWIWEQYDHLVRGQTVIRPGGDASVVRLPGGTKGLALTVDCTPRYCFADPERGGMQAVAETYRNLCATGALPLAITDNMNFGNPERPEIMGQFVGCIIGMRAACLALDYPVVSGNVSLYNETSGAAIQPAPVIGGVGVLADIDKAVGIAPASGDTALVVIGATAGWLGASLYLRELCGREDGAPPPVDLAAEKRHGTMVRALIQDGRVGACHDVADGGLLVAVAEMALAGNRGVALAPSPAGLPAHAYWFGEDQGRYVLSTRDPAAVLRAAEAAGVAATQIASLTDQPRLTLPGEVPISLEGLRMAHEAWMPRFMAGAA
jgi:phosphoribosylformylglycinamidine synthase